MRRNDENYIIIKWNSVKKLLNKKFIDQKKSKRNLERKKIIHRGLFKLSYILVNVRTMKCWTNIFWLDYSKMMSQ